MAKQPLVYWYVDRRWSGSVRIWDFQSTSSDAKEIWLEVDFMYLNLQQQLRLESDSQVQARFASSLH